MEITSPGANLGNPLGVPLPTVRPEACKADDKARKFQPGADAALECLRCVEGAGRSNRAVSIDLSLPDIADSRRRGLRHPAPSEWFGKDVKIVGTNSINFFRISESFKKRTGNELKTNSKLRRKQSNLGAKCQVAHVQTPFAGMCAPHWGSGATCWTAVPSGFRVFWRTGWRPSGLAGRPWFPLRRRWKGRRPD